MIQSNLDSLTHEGLHGWAVDSDAPYYRVPIKCIFNGKLSEIASADQSRPDLIGPTAAKDAFHGFSVRVPLFSWNTGSILTLVAMDATGKDVPIVTNKPVVAYPKLVGMNNGLLNVWFSLGEGGTLVGLQSTEFPHAENLIDNGQPYGRCIQLDLYNHGQNNLNQPIPTEGGWEGDGPFAGGSPVLWSKLENNVFSCATKMREWTTGKVSQWLLTRTTWLDGRTIVSKFVLSNGHPETKNMILSYNWIMDPNLLNTPVRFTGDKTWVEDDHFTECQSRISTLYDLWEGEEGLAMSYSCSPSTNKFFDMPDTIATAYPRCSFSGWRIFNRTFAPFQEFIGYQFTTIAKGVPLSRQLCQTAMTANHV